MSLAKQAARLISNAMPSFVLLALLYTTLIFLLPASPKALQAYDLASLEYKIIILAIALPSLMVWFVAFWGYAKLTEYAHSLHQTPEAINFHRLARGAAWLAWSLPVPMIVALVLHAIGGQQPGFHPTAIVIGNYLNVLMPLVAFTLIGTAARGLVSDARLSFSLSHMRFIMLAFSAAGVLYCFLIFRRFDLTSLSATDNPYFLPIWLMVLTVIIPYLYTWFVGILAAYDIRLFSKNVRGVLYRNALRLLVWGLITVIASSIALQYLNGIQPRVGYLLLNYKLLMVLGFRVLEGVGFLLLVVGASRLKKIEEV